MYFVRLVKYSNPGKNFPRFQGSYMCYCKEFIVTVVLRAFLYVLRIVLLERSHEKFQKNKEKLMNVLY